MEAPDQYWIVLMDNKVSVYLDDTQGELVRRDMQAGIVEYSDALDMTGKPMLIPIKKVALHFYSSPASRALDNQIEERLKAERGFDE